MAKKPTKSAEPAVECCQHCKSHSNKPSYCKLDKKYVGRKTPACEKYKG